MKRKFESFKVSKYDDDNDVEKDASCDFKDGCIAGSIMIFIRLL